MRDHDLSRARHHQTRVKGSVFTTTIWHRHHAVRQRVTQATSHVAFSSSQSAFERRLAAQDHRDPGQIRSGFVSSADESDHLPRQGRKNIRRRCDDAQLEYNSEDRADSQQNVALPCWLSVPGFQAAYSGNLLEPVLFWKTRAFYLDPCRRSFSPHSSSASQRQSSTRLSNVSISLSRFIRSRSSAIFRWESWCQRFGGGVPGGNPKNSSRISSRVNPVSRACCTTARRKSTLLS